MLWFSIVLTHFQPMFHFYAPENIFSGSSEVEHWLKWVNNDWLKNVKKLLSAVNYFRKEFHHISLCPKDASELEMLFFLLFLKIPFFFVFTLPTIITALAFSQKIWIPNFFYGFFLTLQCIYISLSFSFIKLFLSLARKTLFLPLNEDTNSEVKNTMMSIQIELLY